MAGQTKPWTAIQTEYFIKINFSGESFGDITCMNNVPNETLERITVEPIKKGMFWTQYVIDILTT